MAKIDMAVVSTVTLVAAQCEEAAEAIGSSPRSHHVRIKQIYKSWNCILSSKPFSSALLHRCRNHLLCIFA